MSVHRKDHANIHASLVLVGEAGLLVTGASGAGKSALVASILTIYAERRRFARLVADDRVELARFGGKLVGRPHPLLAGRLERRGLGILALPHEPAAVISHAVQLGRLAERLPSRSEQQTTVLGVTIPALRAVNVDDALARLDAFLAAPAVLADDERSEALPFMLPNSAKSGKKA